MPPPRPLRLAPEWDPRYSRMVAVSAAAHMLVVAAVIVVAPYARLRPVPMTAYTVELTDSHALGGRLPPGPITGGLGGPQKAPTPESKGQPEAKAPEPAAAPPKPPEPEPPPKAAEPEPPKPPEQKQEPKVEEQVAKVEPPPVTIPEKPSEPKPEPKPEAKAEPPKPEPPKPEVKPEPAKPAPKPEATPAEPPKPAPRQAQQPAAKPEAKPTTRPPAAKPGDAGAKPGSPTGKEQAPARDAYAAAAERWKSRGGGLAGNDTGSGPIGAGGEGKGGGGQLVGLDFLAYRQAVITTVKGQWTNVFARPGLVAKVRFEIAPDGTVSDVRLEQSSGNSAYDLSAIRAVQHANPLPPPPAHYANDFREFLIEFHSEETGGQGNG